MHIEPFTNDVYKKAYLEDEDFQEVYQQLQSQSHVHDGNSMVDYHLQDRLLYKMDKLCVPKGERLQLIREAHTSKVAGNFGVEKIVANLQRYVYWPKMQEQVARFIRGCMLYCTIKPSNRKRGLYNT